jgi:pimeloyl-ACP methyl ester carboxylesterase
MKTLNINLFFQNVFFTLILFTNTAHAEVSKKIAIKSELYDIPAILSVPEHDSPTKFPLVIMLHGTASQKDEVGDLYKNLSIRLADEGIASIRFDFAGSGESTADYRLYNLKTAVNDVSTIYEYSKTLNHINSNNVHLIGFSQGGLIAQLTATQTDIPIVSMVMWSTVAGNGISSFKPFFDKYQQEVMENGYAAITYPWLPQPLKFDKSWFDQIRTNSSLTDMANYQGKLLTIAGEADKTVPWQNSLSLIKGAKQAQSSLYVIKNANHIFNVLTADTSHADELLEVTTFYLSQQVK